MWGLLGSTNIGNDGSLEAMMSWLAAAHPEAVVDAMCAGHERVRGRYGLPTTALHWYASYDRARSGPMSAPLKVLGKLVDAVRTLRWVSRHDVVIVPGMGVLESTLPLQPWGFPYALFTMCAAGRLTGTKVALVDVGADDIARPATRRLITWAARLATHRSYRDALSRDALSRMGVDTEHDRVVGDLVFSVPVRAAASTEPGTVGVGVMSWYGADGEQRRASELHDTYLRVICGFVRWLIDSGRRVRLFTGDQVDEDVISVVRADVAAAGMDVTRIVVEPVTTLDELVEQMSRVDSVVATRYHNVVCALRLAKPTISLSYAAKGDALMAEMGMTGFCHPARSADLDRLIAQFTEVERRASELRRTIGEHTALAAERLRQQAVELSAELLLSPQPQPAAPSSTNGQPGMSRRQSGAGKRS